MKVIHDFELVKIESINGHELLKTLRIFYRFEIICAHSWLKISLQKKCTVMKKKIKRPMIPAWHHRFFYF